MAYLGIDLGTSAVKVVLVDDDQDVLATASRPLTLDHPAAHAAEQHPDEWWQATAAALDELAAGHRALMGGVRAIGLSGQMHGSVLLDEADRPIRPAILWNDGRPQPQALELRERAPGLARPLGVPAMAGFTGPKLLWLRQHEPESLRRTRTLLLPKDYLRLQLTGERATDMSDAAGTWLLDQAERRWSTAAAAAVGIELSILPRLVEGVEPTGTLRPAIAARFGLPASTLVAGGAGDAAAGGVGIGAVDEGQSFVSLGTSAQFFIARDHFAPAPERFVHAFCHALPGRWYQMAAMLTGASILGAVTRLTGEAEVQTLLGEAEAAFTGPSPLLMLPYLTGERTPHDDPFARGVVFGIDSATTRADFTLAALEGVAFTLADALDALGGPTAPVTELGLIGGGARSRLWARLIAAILGKPIRRFAGGEAGPAFGAARLARLAHTNEPPAAVIAPPPTLDVIAPDPALTAAYLPRLALFRALYQAARPVFRVGSG